MIAFASMVVQVGVVSGGDYVLVGVTTMIGGTFSGLAALVAVIFGVLGITRRGRPQVLAAIGLGAGALELCTLVTWSVIYPLLTAVLSR